MEHPDNQPARRLDGRRDLDFGVGLLDPCTAGAGTGLGGTAAETASAALSTGVDLGPGRSDSGHAALSRPIANDRGVTPGGIGVARRGAAFAVDAAWYGVRPPGTPVRAG